MLDPCFLGLVIALVGEGLIALLWRGPHVMRSMLYPQGVPWITDEKKRQVEAGNALTVVACRLFKIAVAVGVRAICEQP